MTGAASFEEGRATLVGLVRYLLVALSGLSLDYLVAWSLERFGGLDVPVAATGGYLAGMLLVYPLLLRSVFHSRHSRSMTEITLFAFSGALGVGTTFFVSYTLNQWLDYGFHLSKLGAVAVSFVAVFLFRRFIVFGAFR